ncbi:MAG: 16S rRNA (cytosine(1402)-N(4))-methyltransferase RsmH [Proteobacteria bacterium]|nr:16S rRNA (cytosine(1402)-N(4))-methyltransferase RsmH [Pseudomonadota bacterium]
MDQNHKPVLLIEAIESLAIKPDGIYIDGTYGRGGHSKAILTGLSEHGRLLSFDKDTAAVSHAKEKFADDPRFEIVQSSFSDMKAVVTQKGLLGKVNGILLDLGVSSPQLDEPERGFSFLKDGPLDMRMDQRMKMDAATWINSASAAEIADVLKNYGEERYAKRIAGAIVKAREEMPITKTLQLAEIVSQANPSWEKHKHPATRSFQAIRIFINEELSDLEIFLNACLDILECGGRLAIITFHSLEDRIVKRFFRRQIQGEVIPKEVPLTKDLLAVRFKQIIRNAKPTDEEIRENPRARSATLRVVEKII